MTAALSACVAGPKPTQFENSRIYPMSIDDVWPSIIEFLARYSMQIKTIEKDSGIIYAERTQAGEGFADCGTTILAVEVGRPATVNIFVRANGAATEVTVNTVFTVARAFDGRVFSDACLSTGVLETAILDSIRSKS